MLASKRMRHVRDLPLPLLAAFVLSGAALFFGGGAGDSTLPWLGSGAVVLVVVLLFNDGLPGGLAALIPLWLLAAWSAISIEWSGLPDRSWSYANRAFVYALFALVGALLGAKPRLLLYGACSLLGATCVWSLLGKAIPWLYEDYGRIARLRGPVGYWNSLALLGDIALPLGLCLASRHRSAGTLLVYGWIVAIGLTYSRNGIGLAVVGVVLWAFLSGAWIDTAVTLFAAAIPAAGVLTLAFSLSGLTSDGQPHLTRVRDGAVFGVVVLLDAAVAAAFARFEPPAFLSSTAKQAAAVGASIVCVAALVVGGLHAERIWHSFSTSSATELPNGPERITDVGSNFRWTWWKEAWHGFTANPLKGTGAGSFQLTNELYRKSDLDTTIEPHNLPLQVLSETGIVGFVLLIGALVLLLSKAHRRAGPQLALALVLPLYLLHSLLDIDWDFAAVSAPVFLVAGALITQRETRRRVSPFAVAWAGGVGLVLLCSLFAVWLGDRWTNEAGNLLGINNTRALSLVQQARSIDPLSIQPLFTGAIAEAAQAETFRSGAARDAAYLAERNFLISATELQPRNAQPWYELGAFYLSDGCPRAALKSLNRATVLDGQNDENVWYAEALAKVNTGRYRC